MTSLRRDPSDQLMKEDRKLGLVVRQTGILSLGQCQAYGKLVTTPAQGGAGVLSLRISGDPSVLGPPYLGSVGAGLTEFMFPLLAALRSAIKRSLFCERTCSAPLGDSRWQLTVHPLFASSLPPSCLPGILVLSESERRSVVSDSL